MTWTGVAHRFLGLASPIAEVPVLHNCSPAEGGSERQVVPSPGLSRQRLPFTLAEFAESFPRKTYTPQRATLSHVGECV